MPCIFVRKLKYAKDAFRFDILREDCEIILYQIADKHKCTVKELTVMPDHAHSFSELPCIMSPAKALQFFQKVHQLITCSVNILRQGNIFRKGHLWSAGRFSR